MLFKQPMKRAITARRTLLFNVQVGEAISMGDVTEFYRSVGSSNQLELGLTPALVLKCKTIYPFNTSIVNHN